MKSFRAVSFLLKCDSVMVSLYCIYHSQPVLLQPVLQSSQYTNLSIIFCPSWEGTRQNFTHYAQPKKPVFLRGSNSIVKIKNKGHFC